MTLNYKLCVGFLFLYFRITTAQVNCDIFNGGLECRPAVNACDEAEVCPYVGFGQVVPCPPDAIKPSSTQCTYAVAATAYVYMYVQLLHV
jgi:hypothetical protein